MRHSFLALLLANLGFAAWQQWFASPEQAPYVRPDLPTIELASERPDALPSASGAESPGAPDPAAAPPEQAGDGSDDASERVDDLGSVALVDDSAASEAASTRADTPAQADVAAAPAAVEERCVSVGPFRELAQVASAASNLRAGGYEPTQRTDEGDIWVGYWVYLDEIPSREAADQIIENLRENGITDSYVIPESDSGSLVSLGVFSEIARAGARREEVRRLDYEPVIEDRTRRGTVYWVDVLLEGETSLDFDLLQSPGRILRLEQRPCERGAA